MYEVPRSSVAGLRRERVFIYDRYLRNDRRPFLENCLNDGFLKAKNNGQMKFYLMWAESMTRCPQDKHQRRFGRALSGMAAWICEFQRQRGGGSVTSLAELPSTIDGKPVSGDLRYLKP